MAARDGPHIGIVTVHDDFHAMLVADRLQELGVPNAIVPVDSLPGSGGLSWSADAPEQGVMKTADGAITRPGDFDVVWWRRNGLPVIPPSVEDEDARRVVSHSSYAAAYGVLTSSFSGAWVSHPDATRRAENKIVQLAAARLAGLPVPRTLVSQDPIQIRAFAAEFGNRVIAKVLPGVPDVPFKAGLINETMLHDDESLALSPTIYQEYVEGSRHIRACCFGEAVYAALIESADLDWRFANDWEVTTYELGSGLAKQLTRVVSILGLRMGIFDLKLTDDDVPAWLEVNPQGQFLFLEGLCGMPLVQTMAEFLIDEPDHHEVGIHALNQRISL